MCTWVNPDKFFSRKPILLRQETNDIRQNLLAQLAEAVKYSDYFSAEG